MWIRRWLHENRVRNPPALQMNLLFLISALFSHLLQQLQSIALLSSLNSLTSLSSPYVNDSNAGRNFQQIHRSGKKKNSTLSLKIKKVRNLVLPMRSPVAKSVMLLLLAALACAGARGLLGQLGSKIKRWYTTRTSQYTSHADLPQTVPWLYTPRPADQRNTLERSDLQHIPSFYRSMPPTSNLPNKSFPF